MMQHFYRTILSVALLLFATMPLQAQATFMISSTAVSGARIGVAELAGEVFLTVISGASVAQPMQVRYDARITNNSAAEIMVLGTGGFSGIAATPAVNAAAGIISFNIPAGGVPGNSIRIQGVRLDLSTKVQGPLAATITSPEPGGNAILGGQAKVNVISQILAPFSLSLENNGTLTYSGGSPVTPAATFLIREEYVSAFTSDTGLFGQTVPARLRFRPFLPIPEGVRITFASKAFDSATGAFFVTSSGSDETVPRSDGTADVVYLFSGTPMSRQMAESFEVSIELTSVPKFGAGFVNFQVAMEPLGIAVPNAQFPSTDIPRYLEQLLPDEAAISTGFSELQFPFRKAADGIYTGLAVTNPFEKKARVTLRAFGLGGELIEGAGITNPVTIDIPRKGQFAKLAQEIFGPGVLAASHGTIRLEGNRPELAGFYLHGNEKGPGLDGSTAELDATTGWIWPVVFRQDPSASTTLEIHNPGTVSATATLTLLDASGSQIRKGTLPIPAKGSIFQDLRILFPGIDLASFSGGYIAGESDFPLVARQTFGNILESNTLQGQKAFYGLRLHAAHFASGGAYSTELSIVNMHSSLPAILTLTALNDSGVPFPISGNPASLEIRPKGQWIGTAASLFPLLGSALATGSIRIDIQPTSAGYFILSPHIAGALRFSTIHGSSSTLPLFIPPLLDFVFSHIAEAAGYFTGVAVLNPNSVPVEIRMEAFGPDGATLGTYSTALQPGQRFARLLPELIPSTLGRLGGYVRIRADLPVVSFSVFGSDDGRSLGAIPPQNIRR